MDLTQGLIIIGVGLMVVMGILVILVGAVEAVVRFDHYLSDRARAAAAARRAAAESETEPARVPGEVVVAIGLALHQYLEEQARAHELEVLERPRYSGWTSSGRLEIMAARQRLTGKR